MLFQVQLLLIPHGSHVLYSRESYVSKYCDVAPQGNTGLGSCQPEAITVSSFCRYIL